MDEWLELILLCYVGVQTSSRYIELTIMGTISFVRLEILKNVSNKSCTVSRDGYLSGVIGFFQKVDA